MRRFPVFVLLFLLVCSMSYAFGRKNRRGMPNTEAGLMYRVLGCLQNKDSVGYYNLFLPFDTLWRMVLHNPDKSPETVQQLQHLQEHPQSLIDFDPHYNRQIMGGFFKVLNKGEDSGVHWKEIAMQS